MRSLHQPTTADGSFTGATVDDPNLSRTQLSALPDTTCYFFGPSGGEERAKLRVGLCLAKTEELDLGMEAVNSSFDTPAGTLKQTRALSIDWSNRAFGPSVGFPLSEKVSLGVSLNVLRARLKEDSSVSSLLDSGSGVITSGNYSSYGHSWDLAAQVGITYYVDPHWTLGFSMRSPTLHLFDSYNSGFGSTNSGGDGVLETREGSFVVKPPMRFNAGVGFELGWLRAELDVFVHPARSSYLEIDAQGTRNEVSGGLASSSNFADRRREDSSTMVNAAVGVETFIDRDFSLLFGFATDRSAVPQITASNVDQRIFHSSMDYLRASAGIASYTGYGDLVFGLRYDHGSGSLAVLSGNQDVSRWGVSEWQDDAVVLVFAGRVDLHTIRSTADKIADTVEGGAKPPPPASKPQEPLRKPESE
ncbi:MAG: hypothetical protein H6718_05560 [Polyangiaceae bacterium]|nr:hypothetical protein [Myxococcales bacterium]MCB9584841.1 hypothetical protein [Polyangiaceae bacterium]MCB9607586.1 hypothetical protein [Polyangiaceae bacterium]